MRHLSFCRSVAAALLLTICASAIAGEPSGDTHWFVRAHYDDDAAIARLGQHFSHMRVSREQHEIALDVDASGLQILQDEGLQVVVDADATQRMQVAESALRSDHINSIPGFSCYRTVEEGYASMDALVSAHPTLASVTEIGDSWQRTQNATTGYRLRVLKLTNSATDDALHPKPKMFVMSAIHAREYTTAELSMRLVEWLADSHGKNAQATWLLDHNELHFLIQSNPDGRKKAESGLLWRKNTDTLTGNCASSPNDSGIDLNRNYPFMWSTVVNGSSGNKCDETYRGVSAGSEPETQAVVNYVTSIFPDRRVDDTTTAAPTDYQGLFFDIHSFSQLVLWPWGFNSPAPNSAALQTLGRRIAWFNGYTPEQSTDLYPTDGTTDDTFYGRLGLPSYTIELGVAFFEGCGTFLTDTYPKNSAALLYAASTLHAPYQLPSGPEVRNAFAAPDLIPTGASIQLHAIADDSHFNQSQGIEATQPISGVKATLEKLPWEDGVMPIALSADDGSFDRPTEAVSIALSSDGLAIGRHLIYLQGTDSGGADGPPTALFVDIDDAANIATLTGAVRNAVNHLPLTASVRVHDAGQDYQTATAPIDGSYLRTAHPGTVDVDVSAAGFLDEKLVGLELLASATTTRNFDLLPLCPRFSDDVEAGNSGWTAQTPWGIVTNVSGNTTHVWTDSPAGNYSTNRNISLTSPSFSFAGYDQVTLDFDHKCNTEAGADYGRVELSTDAAHTSWSEVYHCSGQTAWQHQTVALSQAAGVADAKLRFRFTSDGGLNFEGWSIDNIRFSAGGTACRASYASDLIFRDGFE